MKNIDFLMTTPLWKGLKEEEIEAILPCLRSEEKFIKKGEFVYRMGDPISSLGVLLQGKLSIEHNDLWGNKTILSMITPGNIFAETYACVPGEPLMVNIVAIEDSRILCLNMLHLLTTCERSCPHHNKLIRNLLAMPKPYVQDCFPICHTKLPDREVFLLTFHLTASSLRII